MMKRTILILTLTLLIAVAFGQRARRAEGDDSSELPTSKRVVDDAVNIGLRLNVGVPQGEFSDNTSNIGFGAGGNISYLPNPYFSVGLGGNFLTYGSQSHTIDLPLVEPVDLETNNNIAQFYLQLQLMGKMSRLRPYVEGRFGGAYVWTESKLEDKDWMNDDQVGRETNYDDFTVTYGFGGGFMLMIAENVQGDDEFEGDIYLDFKGMMMKTTETEYLTEEGVLIDNDLNVWFDPKESPMDMLQIEVGLVIEN
jgi:opacity protein-like surface antigen